MKLKTSSQLWRSLFIPVFLMTLFLLPLLFILVKRDFSSDLIPLSLVNSFIMTGGMLLNIFVFRQLSGKVRNSVIILLIVLTSAGFSISGFIYITLNYPLFFLYGIEVLISYILIIFIIITSLSLFSSGFFNYQTIVDRERKDKETEKKMREEMERQMFSSKINPHFLFNSLNLMISLLDDKEKAEDVLIRLSELLRYNLDASKKVSIPLTQEIDSVEKYLFIQKERFGKRLEYKITGQSHCEVPPLLLQPLVENSIKHNLDHGESIEITISIMEDNKLLYITVLDSIGGLKSEMIGVGTGLELTRRRVELFGGDFRIEKGGIQICLPMR
ncbi:MULTISPECIES: sensor histidine kinase [unclassified Oceanispirochaeta]|uniref:sensor histidine kinase n=1 Tax=unclassified Oceanispirochaeta TaxID=2635722 RepID=UPI000E098D77|nr:MULTISPECIES: histidine kinase [unclassified Oceanispirochaeta]MBF9015014.1 histidine kinase [Oceanispirochaeta sp. M2]NPD71305.1 histidine kinase [Oceanispirochaeta sp. M1]RDG33271.1 hypothetical protein DV872_04250 [Oceanispirochaeta sp. M1]